MNYIKIILTDTASQGLSGSIVEGFNTLKRYNRGKNAVKVELANFELDPGESLEIGFVQCDESGNVSETVETVELKYSLMSTTAEAKVYVAQVPDELFMTDATHFKIEIRRVVYDGENVETVESASVGPVPVGARELTREGTEVNVGDFVELQNRMDKLTGMCNSMYTIRTVTVEPSATGFVDGSAVTKQDGIKEGDFLLYDNRKLYRVTMLQYSPDGVLFTVGGTYLFEFKEYATTDDVISYLGSIRVTLENVDIKVAKHETNIVELSRNATNAKDTADMAFENAMINKVKIAEVETIAKGAQQAYVLNDYTALISVLKLGSEEYNIGQNIYIRKLNVPDVWISQKSTTFNDYNYHGDDAFVEEMKTNAYVQVGYWYVSALETGKAYLENVPTTDEVATNIENGTGNGSVQQVSDGVASGFDFTGKNPNATKLRPSLTGVIPYGAIGAFASSFGGKSSAQGKRSHTEGTTTIAKGNYSHAEGDNSVSLGADSHAEGYATVTGPNAQAAHAEGINTQALGNASHSEGNDAKASGTGAHAEGSSTIASSNGAHAEGAATKATGSYSHSEGYNTSASGEAAHAEGENTRAIGKRSHAEGDGTKAVGNSSHAGGTGAEANGLYSFAHGNQVIAEQDNQVAVGRFNDNKEENIFEVGNGADNEHRSNAFEVRADGSAAYVGNKKVLLEGDGGEVSLNLEDGTGNGSIQQTPDGVADGFDFTGKNPIASEIDPTLTGIIPYGAVGAFASAFGGKSAAMGKRSHAEGTTTVARGNYSHVEGDNAVALGNDSHAEGYTTVSAGMASHAEGYTSIAVGRVSHAEGQETQANGDMSHAEGYKTVAGGTDSHAEGNQSKATGLYSHAENNWTTAEGENSHAEGSLTYAAGKCSHAGGLNSSAQGENSFAHGDHARAYYKDQVAFGTYNTSSSVNALEIGNGTSETDRKNAFEVRKDGSSAYVGGKKVLLEGEGQPSGSSSGGPKIYRYEADSSSSTDIQIPPDKYVEISAYGADMSSNGELAIVFDGEILTTAGASATIFKGNLLPGSIPAQTVRLTGLGGSAIAIVKVYDVED